MQISVLFTFFMKWSISGISSLHFNAGIFMISACLRRCVYFITNSNLLLRYSYNILKFSVIKSNYYERKCNLFDFILYIESKSLNRLMLTLSLIPLGPCQLNILFTHTKKNTRNRHLQFDKRIELLCAIWLSLKNIIIFEVRNLSLYQRYCFFKNRLYPIMIYLLYL